MANKPQDAIDYLAYFAMVLLSALMVFAYLKTGLLEVVYLLGALLVMVVFARRSRTKKPRDE